MALNRMDELLYRNVHVCNLKKFQHRNLCIPSQCCLSFSQQYLYSVVGST